MADSRNSVAHRPMKIPQDYSDWFLQFKKSEEYEILVTHPVAYFCAEYALDSILPTYAGGLGVLAGDFVREAAVQSFPLVAVGLFYRKAQSTLSVAGGNKDSKLRLFLDLNQVPVVVSLPLEGRIVSARAWHWEDSTGAQVYLLDTDVPENDPRDRDITKNLYDEDRDIRLKQEIILGIGGFRLLARIGYHASVYHLNEGHSAFLALELVRHEMEHQRANFLDACNFAKKHILFTNHTLVPEGQEQFFTDKVSLFMTQYAKEMGITGADIAKLGAMESDPNIFSMTTLSFKLSSKSNAVSRFHSEKALKIWPNEAINNVTNGVFAGRWDKIDSASDLDIWKCHLANKRKLLRLVEEGSGEVWGETDLICVWARRLVNYKQPLLFLENTDKILAIAKKSSVPIRLIFSGPTGGERENPYEEKIKKIIAEKLPGLAVFLPHYSTDLAEVLTAGADVWLNTPLPGTEACGTSGMKAGLNGALALSLRDGWVHEIEPADIGWVASDLPKEDLFSLLEYKIIPLYDQHLKNPAASVWLTKMQSVRNFILTNFSTSRVLAEYIEKLYVPILRQKHAHKID